MIENIELVDLEFTIRPESQLNSPILPESTLRGGIGYTLKQIVCHESVEQSCQLCQARQYCTYPSLFERMEDIREEQQYIGYVRPFVVSTPLHKRGTITNEQSFTFSVRIFGEAISYVPHIVASVLKLSEKGIGRQKQKFTVESIVSRNEIGMAKRIFSSEDRVLSEPWVISGKRIAHILSSYKNCREIEIRFETPCQIQIKGQLQQELPFSLFMQNLLRRMQAMLTHHQHISISPDEMEQVPYSSRPRCERKYQY